MAESKQEKFIQRQVEALRKDRKPDYLDGEPFRTNRVLEENLKLIQEKELEPGKKVWLNLLKMKGEVIEIREKERNSVVVKREDGETFAYTPQEMDLAE